MFHTWLLRLGVYLLREPRFRKWSELEDKKYDVIKAIEQGTPNFPELLYAYFSIALDIYPKNYDTVYWKESIAAFLKIHSVTVPEKTLPLISRHNDSKEKKDAWDYSGRLWFFYSNIIASVYGWGIKQIASLPVREALAYIQEILTDKQLEHEFVWSTSQVAYAYNKSTKKSDFKSLQRPYWMFAEKEEPKKIPIKRSLLPVGNVIRLEDAEAKETTPE